MRGFAMLVRGLLIPLLLVTSPALAADAPFCRALKHLKAAAHSEPQSVRIIKAEPMTLLCGRSPTSDAQKAFCAVAAHHVSMEFTDVFPWMVHDCLRAEGLSPQVETVDQYTGMSRQKLRHLSADWRDGTHLDVRFQPTGDRGEDARLKDYWGYYELVIRKP
jgi:hypothetical protein